MKKILFIDTNIFIQCAFLEVEDGDTISSLEKVLELLTGGTFLLLPEVTELEIDSGLIKREKEFQASIDELKDKSKKYDGLGKNVTKDINDAISGVLKQRLANYEKVKDTIKKIFAHSNLIKVPLKPEHIVEAYKYSITKRRPFTEKNVGEKGLTPSIQSDCLNIIAIKEALDKESDYEFYLCARDSDFYDGIDKSKVKGSDSVTETSKLHQDIADIIEVKAYHDNLLQLLNDQFGLEFRAEEISEFDKSQGLTNSILETSSILPGSISSNLVGETKDNSCLTSS